MVQREKNSSDVYFVKLIGDYWNNTVTQGRGAYWNINEDANQYEKLGRFGIGVINYNDTELRKNLQEHVIQYLCKPDQFIRPKFGYKVRLFRRGHFPKKPFHSRPRKALHGLS